jgi:hypothetical protein
MDRDGAPLSRSGAWRGIRASESAGRSRSALALSGDPDLLAVPEEIGQVDALQIGIGGRAAGLRQRIGNPRIGRQLIDGRIADRADNVDTQGGWRYWGARRGGGRRRERDRICRIASPTGNRGAGSRTPRRAGHDHRRLAVRPRPGAPPENSEQADEHGGECGQQIAVMALHVPLHAFTRMSERHSSTLPGTRQPVAIPCPAAL